MRAVNLIPSEARKGGGRASSSGGGVYVLLGALAALVLMMGAYVSSRNQLSERRADLVQVKRNADAAEAKVASLVAYSHFSDLRAKRVDTVKSLASQRFDWSSAMHEVARVIPKDTWLTNLVGTVAPGVAVDGAGAQTGTLRSAISAPAIEISGCTTSQSAVAQMMARMRQINGVQRVSLAASEKGDTLGGGGEAAGDSASANNDGADCRHGSDRFPRFELVVFFGQVTHTTTPSEGSSATTTASALQSAAGNAQNPQTAPGETK